MAKAKYKIGDEVKIDGEKKVIIGIVDMDAHEDKFETKKKTSLIPQPDGKDKKKTVEYEEPVLERFTGYLVQDPKLPWNRHNCTWIRASRMP